MTRIPGVLSHWLIGLAGVKADKQSCTRFGTQFGVAVSSGQAIKIQQNVYNDEPVYASAAVFTHLYESNAQHGKQTVRKR